MQWNMATLKNTIFSDELRWAGFRLFAYSDWEKWVDRNLPQDHRSSGQAWPKKGWIWVSLALEPISGLHPSKHPRSEPGPSNRKACVLAQNHHLPFRRISYRVKVFQMLSSMISDEGGNIILLSLPFPKQDWHLAGLFRVPAHVGALLWYWAEKIVS